MRCPKTILALAFILPPSAGSSAQDCAIDAARVASQTERFSQARDGMAAGDKDTACPLFLAVKAEYTEDLNQMEKCEASTAPSLEMRDLESGISTITGQMIELGCDFFPAQ